MAKSTKPTQHEIIVNYLQSNGGWIPSYKLEKEWLNGNWIGTRGSRSARDLNTNDVPDELKNLVTSKEGKVLVSEGHKIDGIGNPIIKKYAYYRHTGCIPPKPKQQVVTYNEQEEAVISYK